MSLNTAAPDVPLEATSPFELRVNQSERRAGVVRQEVALDSGDVGFLHSFTTGSAVDGPGVRVVAWTAGCHLRCRYCHNPDTWTMTNGMPVPLERAVDELRKYRHGLQVMSGGLTISGGEPLMQDRFVVRLFARPRKAMGVHTALETNGYLGDRLSDDELDQIDLVLLGLKSWGPAPPRPHRQGQRRHPRLRAPPGRARRPVWVRFVLVPGLTDDTETSAKSPASPAAWATSSASTCSRSTRWAGSNGRSSA